MATPGYRLMSNNEYVYECVELRAITDDICHFVLRPQDAALKYEAGQYVEVQLASGYWLPLSIANVPAENHYLSFDLRHSANHPSAKDLWQQIQQQPTLNVRGPFGQFTQDRACHQQWLFLAGGTGIVPIKAVLTQLLKQPLKNHCYLYWGIKRPEDAYEIALLEEWKNKDPLFSYTLVLSEPVNHPHWSGATGYVHEHMLKKHQTFNQASFFACGPFSMIKTAKQLLIAQGLAENAFFSDV
jgi:CDP-4-dehydro-6-deoxyglucose reductase, E3